MSTPHSATLAARAGIDRDSAFGAVVPPIVLSSNFSFAGFEQKRQYDYTRSGNPTRDLLADALTEIGCRYVRIASIALDQPGQMLQTQDRMAGVEVAHYLESLGHRQLGLITGPRRYRSSIERGDGFSEAAKSLARPS